MPEPDLPSPIAAEEIFRVAAALPEAERAAYLDAACEGQSELRARVGRMLEVQGIGAFLQHPPDETLPPEIEAELARLKPEEGGERIGNYKLLEQIGEGGFGIVWMAEQIEPVRRRVALKIIKLGMDTKEVIARFEQERQALAMMDHPNIAKVFDAGATQWGRPYFVMELVRGIRITEYCDQNNLPTAERLGLFIAVCNAVQHAHQKGIIHRDLKPSNVLVTLHDGVPVPKVIDFGVAKATQPLGGLGALSLSKRSRRLTDLTLFTQFEQMIGTPLYMSPEQAELTSLDIDTRSDIYSLGVLLYELLTGRTPFDPEELMRKGHDEMRRVIREQEPQKPSTALSTMAADARTTIAQHRQADSAKLVGLIRGDLDWIVMKALEKDRARRYETASSLASDIQRHLQSDPVIARPPSGLYRFRRLVKRNKVAFVAGTAIATALVIGAGVSIWQGIRAQRGEARANAALADLRATAPAFVAQARALVAKERFEEAIEKLDYASKLQPESAEYLLGKADLFECQFRFAEAARVYQTVLQLSPGNARAVVHVALCQKLGAEQAAQSQFSITSLTQLMAAMVDEHRSPAEIMPVARLTHENGKLVRDYWIERLSELPIPAGKPLAERLTVNGEGLALDLARVDITDLRALSGMPLKVLNLSGCERLDDLQPLTGLPLKALNLLDTGVTNLAPLGEIRTLERLAIAATRQLHDLSGLRGLLLKELTIIGTEVTDLVPLRGMPIETLELRKTPVTDLAPLAELPLLKLECTGIDATNFSPLAGTSLQILHLKSCNVRDLSFLRGMQLHTISLEGCENARQFQALAGLMNLETLILPENVMSLPLEELVSINALRGHPTLRQIGIEHLHSSEDGSVSATVPKEVFWTQWDREFPWIRGLHRAGVTFTLKRSTPTGSLRDSKGVPPWELTITTPAFDDLSLLKGAAISRLILDHTHVSDLTPLAGMPLNHLSLKETHVTDLSPLAGMPLTFLGVQNTLVTDLSVLKNLALRSSLEELHLWSSKVTDFSMLAECTALTIFDADGTGLSDLEMLHGRLLKVLSFAGTRVTDLAPIAGMPLKSIRFEGTNVTDLTPLLKCPTLERIILPKEARNIGALRVLPKLNEIAFTNVPDGEPRDATDFWPWFSNGEALREMAQGHLADAEVILTRAAEDMGKKFGYHHNSRMAVLNELGTCYCWQGRFAAAVPLFREALQTRQQRSDESLFPDEASHWLRLAAALVVSGDVANYRSLCAAMVQRFRGIRDSVAVGRVLRVCSLAPDSGISDSELRAFVETAKPLPAGDIHAWYHAGAACVEYRAGRWNEAAELLTNIKDEGTAVTAYGNAVLVMVHHRRREPAAAQIKLESARKLIAAHWPPRKSDDGGRWSDWLIAQLLLKEAEVLVGRVAPATE